MEYIGIELDRLLVQHWEMLDDFSLISTPTTRRILKQLKLRLLKPLSPAPGTFFCSIHGVGVDSTNFLSLVLLVFSMSTFSTRLVYFSLFYTFYINT